MSDHFGGSGWRTVAALVWPYRRSLVVVAIFALLATGTDLLAPLIYREAVNDIAGLFVGTSAKNTDSPLDATTSEERESSPSPILAQKAVSKEIARAHSKDKPKGKAVREPHRRHYVAPRTADQTLTTLLWAVISLFAINVFSHLCSLVADQRTVELASRIEADFIHNTFSHVLSLPLRFFARRASGGLAKQIDQSDEIAPIVTAFAQEIAPAVITMAGVMIIMFLQSTRLSLVALVTLPPYAWIVLRSSKRLETGLARYYEMWDGVSARIQEAVGAIKTVKLSGAEQREAAHLLHQSRQAYDTYVERNRLANRYVFFQTSLGYLSQALVLGYGGWLVFQRGLTPGDVVMFVVYLERLYAPIESLTSLFVTLQEHFASLERATKLREVPGEEAHGDMPRPGPGRVEFRHVHFSYVPGREVLSDVSLVLEAGKRTALVGPSGAGKTTAADLLLKLFDLDSGEILMDGQTLSHLDAAAVRREFGVVAADGAIFRGSIADNLRYKRPEATDEEVHAAALAAGLTNTLARLPQGLATEIGEGGVGLSVGERQRLQIARALVGQPRVLILDEATANLDYATETEIRHALLGQSLRPTTLVITHRYTMAEICDHVIVLQAGRVIAQGAP
ncbi:MAG: ABC transporter ATP-binding protein, partial [Rhodospirillaceae bacterium]